jgi:outer membrane lipoprotein-sorting protein
MTRSASKFRHGLRPDANRRMKMKRILPLLLLLLPFGQAMAATPEEQGLEIATEADRRDTGFGNYTSDVKMVLRNKQGQESTREIRSRTLEVDGDGDKSMTIFDAPGDVKGTALLTFTHKEGPDDQWLYLPALKRVKRIASDNKSGPFMGSEFAYEDIASQEVEKYTYRFLRDDVYDGIEVFVYERYPVDKKSGYTRQIVWLDKEHYKQRKIEFYDRKDVLLKTLVFNDYHQYLDQYWRAHDMYMENHQTGKSTRLLQTNYQFRTGLTDRDFDKNSLKRAR